MRARVQPRWAWSVVIAGCVSSGAASSLLPPVENPWTTGQDRCSIERSSTSPLTVDWPAADRGALERRLARGGVIVRYHGCEMQLLRRCRLPGSGYRYGGFTRKREDVRISDVDELYAQLPVGAARLEGKLARESEIAVTATLVGMYELEETDVARTELRGECEGATHVVTAASVGAYALELVRAAEVGGRAELRGAAGVGGESRALRETVSRDGDPDRCEEAAEGDAAPPVGCGAVLRIDVLPLLDELDAPCPGALQWNGSRCVGTEDGPTDATCPERAVRVDGGWLDGQPIDAFCLDRTEVTVTQYRACVEAYRCAAPATEASWARITAAERLASRELCNAADDSREDHPINCIAWAEAGEYCRSVGGQLPTDRQWRWAAGGGEEERRYPWGGEPPSPRRVNACGSECRRWFAGHGRPRRAVTFEADDGFAGTAPVGSFPAGAGRFGTLDLAGNVAEWTRDHGGAADDSRRIRGGSFWAQRQAWLSSADSAAAPPERRDPLIGFRCVHPVAR